MPVEQQLSANKNHCVSHLLLLQPSAPLINVLSKFAVRQWTAGNAVSFIVTFTHEQLAVVVHSQMMLLNVQAYRLFASGL